jgi:hypothetical protein
VDVLSSDEANVTSLANCALFTVRSYVSYVDAYNYNSFYFPVDNRHDCFYRAVPPLVRWTLPDELGPFVAAMVFFGLAAVALAVWGFAEAVHCCRHRGYSHY